jgi:hypothetical protein
MRLRSADGSHGKFLIEPHWLKYRSGPDLNVRSKSVTLLPINQGLLENRLKKERRKTNLYA